MMSIDCWVFIVVSGRSGNFAPELESIGETELDVWIGWINADLELSEASLAPVELSELAEISEPEAKLMISGFGLLSLLLFEVESVSARLLEVN